MNKKHLLMTLLCLKVFHSDAMDHRRSAKKMHHMMTQRKVSDTKGLPKGKGLMSGDAFFQALLHNHVTSVLGESKKEQCKQLQKVEFAPSFRSSLSRTQLYGLLSFACISMCAQNVGGFLTSLKEKDFWEPVNRGMLWSYRECEYTQRDGTPCIPDASRMPGIRFAEIDRGRDWDSPFHYFVFENQGDVQTIIDLVQREYGRGVWWYMVSLNAPAGHPIKQRFVNMFARGKFHR